MDAPRVAVVTGAGSGIGRATALRLAQAGWHVALVGRREPALVESIALAGPADDRLAAFPCDIGDPKAVEAMASAVLARYGRVDALVNSAGMNVPRRSFAALVLDEYAQVIATNLHGAVYCVIAFLPAMRRQGGGTIVNINSEAGRAASAKSGVAYVVSKFGLTGLTQSINAEERGHGIRACSIFPGDVDTPLVDRRPQPPSAEARRKFLQPTDVAEAVWLAVSLPGRAIIEELLLRPA